MLLVEAHQCINELRIVAADGGHPPQSFDIKLPRIQPHGSTWNLQNANKPQKV
jgi:hypothetical protein